ncbi:hypothetical protein D9M70_397020 [compost metagenome]
MLAKLAGQASTLGDLAGLDRQPFAEDRVGRTERGVQQLDGLLQLLVRLDLPLLGGGHPLLGSEPGLELDVALAFGGAQLLQGGVQVVVLPGHLLVEQSDFLRPLDEAGLGGRVAEQAPHLAELTVVGRRRGGRLEVAGGKGGIQVLRQVARRLHLLAGALDVDAQLTELVFQPSVELVHLAHEAAGGAR